MNPGPHTGRRWVLSPVDSCSHLLTEHGDDPVGMLVTRCGRLLPCSVDISAHPPAGLRCPACAQGGPLAGVHPPVRGAGVVADLNPQLLATLALRRACDGGIAKAGDRYVDHGSPTPGYLADTFDELINTGYLALAEQDLYGLRRVSVTEAGHARLAQLEDGRRRAGLWVPPPRYPTTEPAPASHRPSTPQPAAGGAPDPVGGRTPARHWVRCPTDGRLHAIDPTRQPPTATPKPSAATGCPPRI